MSIIPKIVVFESSCCTHVHLCMLFIHINDMDSILIIIISQPHLFLFSHLCQYFLKYLWYNTLNFTHSWIYILSICTSVIWTIIHALFMWKPYPEIFVFEPSNCTSAYFACAHQLYGQYLCIYYLTVFCFLCQYGQCPKYSSFESCIHHLFGTFCQSHLEYLCLELIILHTNANKYYASQVFFIWQEYLLSFCHIYVNNSWNNYVTNFKLYTQVHLYILCTCTSVIWTIFQVFFMWQVHLMTWANGISLLFFTYLAKCQTQCMS